MFDLVRGMPFCLRDVAMDLSSFYTSVFSVLFFVFCDFRLVERSWCTVSCIYCNV